MGGRLSNLYNPKYVFILGFGLLGVLSNGMSFINHKLGMLVIRGITGAFAAFTIPPALHLIVHIWPDPVEQEKAISNFGASGASVTFWVCSWAQSFRNSFLGAGSSFSMPLSMVDL